MLVSAALVPDSPLLVPGPGGRAGLAPEVAGTAEAAEAAVRVLLAARPDEVAVVAGVARRHVETEQAGPLSDLLPTFGAAGVPTGARRSDGGVVVRAVGAALGVELLRRAGWSGQTHVLALAQGGCAAERRERGAGWAQGSHEAQRAGRAGRAGRAQRSQPAERPRGSGPSRRAMLVLGGLSARRGPDAPLPPAPGAEAFDDAVLADLVGWDAPARARLADVPAERAAGLAVSAWSGWQVLLGAAADVPLRGRLLAAGAPLGATWPVVTWEPA